jgi:hypothetical protein
MFFSWQFLCQVWIPVAQVLWAITQPNLPTYRAINLYKLYKHSRWTIIRGDNNQHSLVSAEGMEKIHDSG